MHPVLFITMNGVCSEFEVEFDSTEMVKIEHTVIKTNKVIGFSFIFWDINFIILFLPNNLISLNYGN